MADGKSHAERQRRGARRWSFFLLSWRFRMRHHRRLDGPSSGPLSWSSSRPSFGPASAGSISWRWPMERSSRAATPRRSNPSKLGSWRQSMCKTEKCQEGADPHRTGHHAEPGGSRSSANEYQAAQVEAARLRAFIAGQSTLNPSAQGRSDLCRLQQQFLLDQLAEYQARIEAAYHLIDQTQCAMDGTRENIRRLDATVPMEAERAATHKKLARATGCHENGLSPSRRTTHRQNARAGRAEEEAPARSGGARRSGEELSRARFGVSAKQTAELAAIRDESHLLTPRSPENRAEGRISKNCCRRSTGWCRQLAVHTVGGVVTPAQQFLIVVPQDHPVEVEAQVENKDIGFVKEKQLVEMKVETFPFTLYGTIPGKVLSVSDDAIPL